MPPSQCTGVVSDENNDAPPGGHVWPPPAAALVLVWLLPGWGWVSTEAAREQRCLRLPGERRSISSQINGYCEAGRKAARCDTVNRAAPALSHLWNRLVSGRAVQGVFALDFRWAGFDQSRNEAHNGEWRGGKKAGDEIRQEGSEEVLEAGFFLCWRIWPKELFL